MEEAKSIWGPRLWAEIHSTAAKSSPAKFRKYLGTLPPRIPCEDCRYHFRSYVFTNPLLDFEDPMIWSIDFHNAVNRRLGKKVLTYQEAYEKGLNIMDMTAFTLCQENNLPIIVFNMNKHGNLFALLSGEKAGTLIS